MRYQRTIVNNGMRCQRTFWEHELKPLIAVTCCALLAAVSYFFIQQYRGSVAEAKAADIEKRLSECSNKYILDQPRWRDECITFAVEDASRGVEIERRLRERGWTMEAASFDDGFAARWNMQTERRLSSAR